jgi:tryptophanyl-tRNA synthetase
MGRVVDDAIRSDQGVQRALTGIKPTGHPHLGNLLGAIRPALALQERYDAFYFIADYHALTSIESPEELRQATREVVATWLALGLDPQRTVLFRQSAIPEVCELAWILGCTIPFGVLERGHAVKAAREDDREPNVGTWYYPVLMAADILLYDTAIVPIGKDQKQHVEIARDLAIKMNHRYGDDTLVVPAPSILDDVATIPGLDGRKMSKSYGNEIAIWAPSKQLRKLVMKIVTDSKGVDEPKDPDSCNVFALYRLFAPPDRVADLRRRYEAGGMGYGTAKQELFEVLDAALDEPRRAYEDWMGHPHRLEEILAVGAERARAAADVTLRRIRDRVGLTPARPGLPS